MNKRVHSMTTNRQGGQFVVNLAEILVSAGLVIGTAFQAQVFLQDYQFEAYYDELKEVESVLWAFKDATGRWPGDCDSNGVIDIGMASTLENSSEKSCALDINSQEALIKVFSDLASQDMLDDKLRTKFADDDGQYMQVAHGTNSSSKEKNVLVAFNVSTELAQWLDKKIDGALAAGDGRIRLWEAEMPQEWPKSEEVAEVSIAYYFDEKI